MKGGAVQSELAVLSLFLLVAAASVAAAADPQAPSQGPAQAAAAQPGPLLLQSIEGGFVFAPEVRLTRIDGSAGTQFGGYAGWLFGDSFLIGGGGYGLVSGPNGVGMNYGGIVGRFTMPAGKSVRIGVGGLFGGGEARLPDFLPAMCASPAGGLRSLCPPGVAQPELRRVRAAGQRGRANRAQGRDRHRGRLPRHRVCRRMGQPPQGWFRQRRGQVRSVLGVLRLAPASYFLFCAVQVDDPKPPNSIVPDIVSPSILPV